MSADTLFELPETARKYPHRVVLLAGPSGAGKSRLPRILGVPALHLDEFYRDYDYPGMPRRHGMVDWDSPACWDGQAALETLVTLCRSGAADVPVYDIPTSQRTGWARLELVDSPIVVAEGIFAGELVAGARAAGILADALCLVRPRLHTFYFRLLRDFAQARKPPLQLLRRGFAHLREEPEKVARWVAQGCRPVTLTEAGSRITALSGLV
ncbi:MAG: ATP-binding protein [Bowdeniella nasicola]|nr:ATP-binding protein [Bowdeniella nasicola]